MSFLCFLAGIKVRIGYNYKGRGFFLNHKILLKGYENKHVVEHYLELLNALGIKAKDKHLELFLSKEDISWADNFFKTNSINSKFVIGIVPGGGGSWGKDAIYKQWPHENYAKLADKLFEKFRASLILFGDKNEIELCKKTAGLMKSKAILACGNTTISQFAALSRKCSLNILNDGGPLHIAAASGAKTISIFGPVDEEVYGPYPKENHEVVTSSVACGLATGDSAGLIVII